MFLQILILGTRNFWKKKVVSYVSCFAGRINAVVMLYMPVFFCLFVCFVVVVVFLFVITVFLFAVF